MGRAVIRVSAALRLGTLPSITQAGGRRHYLRRSVCVGPSGRHGPPGSLPACQTGGGFGRLLRTPQALRIYIFMALAEGQPASLPTCLGVRPSREGPPTGPEQTRMDTAGTDRRS